MTAALAGLDGIRNAVLKRSLKLPLLRRLFHSRPERLVLMFLVNTIILLPIAIYHPWFLLTVGPLVFGLPHLGSTVRYASKFIDDGKRKPAALVLTVGMAAVALVRLRFPGGGNHLELTGCCLLLAVLLGTQFTSSRQTLIALGLLAPLFLASFLMPTATVQTLILGHNFVAFAFWIKEARRKQELGAPLLCLGVFSLIHLALAILPGQTWEIAFAYGQATHYFVWLRVIPEQHLASTAPVSFRRSWKLLMQDFGRKGTLCATGIIILFSGAGLLVNLEDARRLYFALAAFHGYAELTMFALAIGGIGGQIFVRSQKPLASQQIAEI